VALGESGLVGGFVLNRVWELDTRGEFGESAPIAGGVAVGFAAGVFKHVFEELAVEQGSDKRVLGFEVAGVSGEGFPLASAEAVDADGDNISDAEEQELGTDPNNPDTDNNGVLVSAEPLKMP